MSQKEDKEFCIEILDRILKEFGNYTGSYSFGEYAEEAVCLEKNGFSWIVYEGERGRK